jgi:hypothetical protein
MAFVWVQQWIALPVVFEEQMGDVPPGVVPQPLDITAAGLAHDENQGQHGAPASSLKPGGSNAPFHSQLSSIAQGQSRPDIRSPTQYTTAQFPGQDHGGTALNMASMASALPEFPPMDTTGNPHIQQSSQRTLSGASTSALVYQLQQNLQMPGPAAGSLQAHPNYGAAYGSGHFPQGFVPTPGSQHPSFASFNPNQQRVAGANAVAPHFQNYQQASPYMYYPAPYGHQGQFPQSYPGQSQAMYGRRMSGGNVPVAGHTMDAQDAPFSPLARQFGGQGSDAASMGNMPFPGT